LAAIDAGPGVHAVHVVSNGLHTSIVVEYAELVATGLLPEAKDFRNASFLEFGWGDHVYYPARDETLGMALKAALIPTPAVMHVAALADTPKDTDHDVEVVSVALTHDGFRRMVGAIAGDFMRQSGRRALPKSRGLSSDSYFYDANGSFHLFNTCNTWTARTLRAGGVNISPSGVITADDAMARLRATIVSAPKARP
jgi:uncharacterized protein (TIGR02117 family)